MMGKKKMGWGRADYQMVGGIKQRKGGYEGRGTIWYLESEFSFLVWVFSLEFSYAYYTSG